ncbi:MAG: sulfurtransferase [Chloroflexi bacterium]|nr:sulfurtransferase [Chloroflexota bacterium]
MYSTIISVSDLQRLMAAPAPLVICDCRHRLGVAGAGYQLYRQGHIAGAIFADLDRQLSARPGMTPHGHSGRHPLPEPEAWLKTLGEWGITPATQVAAYDDAGGAYAARLWWMLRSVGHQAVAVLNGSLQAWAAAGGSLETSETQPTPAPSPYPAPARYERLMTIAEVREAMELPGPRRPLLVDARAPNRYRGEGETVDALAGHIPGALNRYYMDNLNPDGAFRAPQELRSGFQPLIERAGERAVVMYCGSGVSACHNLLALEIAGLPAARLFPNSWSGWSSTPGLPVATGDE